MSEQRPNGDPTPDPTGDLTWLPIPEAAAALGITSDALRMRLKRGTAAGRKDAGRWLVLVDAIQPNTEPTPTQQAEHLNQQPNDRPQDALLTAKDQAIAHLGAEVVFLRDQLDQRSRELAAERERFDVLQREALSRIPALGSGEIGVGPLTASPAVQGATGNVNETPDTSPSPPSRWRRWVRALVGS